jgi:hypothetical protein
MQHCKIKSLPHLAGLYGITIQSKGIASQIIPVAGGKLSSLHEELQCLFPTPARGTIAKQFRPLKTQTGLIFMIS